MSGLMPPNVLAYEGQVVVPFLNRTFDPNSSNFQFDVPTIWINTSSQSAFILVAKPQNVAVWLPFAGGTANLETLTGDDGIAVFPSASNINELGNAVANATHAKPIFFRSGGNPNLDLDVQVSAAAASSNINNAGLSSFKNSQFSVDSNGFVTLVGGSTPPILGMIPDAHTAPGTSPVIPNGSGNITVTGGQVAAGTTTNVIQTDSLAANTYAIQIQRSQAVGSSTIGDNGVSHFDSTRFTVDANGFVSTNGSGVGETITGQSGGALSPTSGNWNIFGASTAAGTSPVTTSGSVSTLTVNIQKSQAIAATDATKVGLAVFNSADFIVDANGFVSLISGSLNYTNVNHAASPYTVLATDYFISVDCSAGTVQLNFPNAPTFKQQWVVKDRTGNASTNNISITTPGGTVTIDGLTIYKITSNFGAVNLLANATPTYEVY